MARVTLTTTHWGRSANARELLFYLLEHSPSRKEDIGLNFWPDLSMARMTSSFHAAKYRARRALGVEFVVYDDDRYRLNSLLLLSYDVAEFRRLVEASRQAATDVERTESLRLAVQLYTSDYLTDVSADWAVATRAELHHQFFEALTRLVTILLRQHCYAEVIALSARPRDRLLPREFTRALCSVWPQQVMRPGHCGTMRRRSSAWRKS
jgi:two-component SAPR family response regulator